MYTADVDIEGELIQPGDNGSEIEDEHVVVVSLLPKNVLEIDDLDDPTLADDVQSLCAEADVALRAMTDPEDSDVLFFDGRGNSN